MASCVFVVRASVVQLSDFCVHPSLVVAVACALLLHVFPLLVLLVLLFCNIKIKQTCPTLEPKLAFGGSGWLFGIHSAPRGPQGHNFGASCSNLSPPGVPNGGPK